MSIPRMNLPPDTHPALTRMPGVVAFLVFLFTAQIHAQPCELLTFLPDSITEDARFGRSAALEGSVLAIGAHRQDLEAGTVTVFEQVPDQPAQWQQTAVLTAPDRRPRDAFGISVALSGSTLVVGAYLDDAPQQDSGAAYVFRRTQDATWEFVTTLIAPDGRGSDEFGYSVDIDQNVIIVGARNDNSGLSRADSAYIFERPDAESDDWQPVAKLTASDQDVFDWFGSVVTVSDDMAAVSAWRDDDRGSDSGSVYVYQRDNLGVWTETQKLTAIDGRADDRFGIDIDMSPEWLIVGATGKNLDVIDAGAAYLFKPNGEGKPEWEPVARLAASDAVALDFFGVSVAVDGDVAAVASYHANATGAVYIFDLARGQGQTRTEDSAIHASTGQPNDRFGRSLAIHGNRVAVGAYRDDDLGLDTGAAFLFAINSEFALTEVSPAIAGEVNAVRAVCATPHGDVSFVYGIAEGTTPVPACGGLVIDIRSPRLAATITADINGHATLVSLLPIATRGLTIRLQAIDHMSCTISPVSVQYID